MSRLYPTHCVNLPETVTINLGHVCTIPCDECRNGGWACYHRGNDSTACGRCKKRSVRCNYSTTPCPANAATPFVPAPGAVSGFPNQIRKQIHITDGFAVLRPLSEHHAFLVHGTGQINTLAPAPVVPVAAPAPIAAPAPAVSPLADPAVIAAFAAIGTQITDLVNRLAAVELENTNLRAAMRIHEQNTRVLRINHKNWKYNTRRWFAQIFVQLGSNPFALYNLYKIDQDPALDERTHGACERARIAEEARVAAEADDGADDGADDDADDGAEDGGEAGDGTEAAA